MSKLQNDFTTPEQSKRLLELGVPADSADCYYVAYNDSEDYEISVRTKGDTGNAFFKVVSYIPCWSVGRLIEIAKICSESRYALRGLFLFLEECEADECMSQVMDYFETCNYQFDFSKLEE